MRRLRLGAALSLTGPYAELGGAAADAIRSWADARGVAVEIRDDRGEPGRAAGIARELARAYPVLMGPYGSGPARAVAAELASSPTVLWNHGGAALGESRGRVIDVLSPAERYWSALPGALAAAGVDLGRVAILRGRSGFAAAVASGAERALGAAGARPLAVLELDVSSADSAVEAACAADAEAVVGAGRIDEELAAGRALSRAGALGALVVCGIGRAGEELGDSVRGWLGPAQWVPERGRPPIDLGADPEYPAAQALAACLLLERARARALSPDDPDALWAAAVEMRTRTFFGSFAVDRSGRQVGHEPLIVRWVGRGASLRREPAPVAVQGPRLPD